jgi:hypothetical protein
MTTTFSHDDGGLTDRYFAYCKLVGGIEGILECATDDPADAAQRLKRIKQLVLRFYQENTMFPLVDAVPCDVESDEADEA